MDDLRSEPAPAAHMAANAVLVYTCASAAEPPRLSAKHGYRGYSS